MDSDMILLEVTDKMDKAMENLIKRFTTVRAGRANPSSLDGVMVEYYGSMTPLKQLATIAVPEARQLLIKPFDKSSLGAIEKGILAANLGYTPGNDGETIRIIIPELTEERRKELVKSLGKVTEGAKVACRNIRREGNDDIKKLKLPEDDEKGYIEDIQKLTDKYMDKIDKETEIKEKELMEI